MESQRSATTPRGTKTCAGRVLSVLGLALAAMLAGGCTSASTNAVDGPAATAPVSSEVEVSPVGTNTIAFGEASALEPTEPGDLFDWFGTWNVTINAPRDISEEPEEFRDDDGNVLAVSGTPAGLISLAFDVSMTLASAPNGAANAPDFGDFQALGRDSGLVYNADPFGRLCNELPSDRRVTVGETITETVCILMQIDDFEDRDFVIRFPSDDRGSLFFGPNGVSGTPAPIEDES